MHIWQKQTNMVSMIIPIQACVFKTQNKSMILTHLCHKLFPFILKVRYKRLWFSHVGFFLKICTQKLNQCTLLPLTDSIIHSTNIGWVFISCLALYHTCRAGPKKESFYESKGSDSTLMKEILAMAVERHEPNFGGTPLTFWHRPVLSLWHD